MFDFWNGKRVLVTGHTGFKGSWMSLWLTSLGAEVCGFALRPDTEPNLFDGLDLTHKVRSVIGDVQDRSLLKQTVLDFRPAVIFHLAAQSLVRRSYRFPVETYSTNVMGTIHVLDAARRAETVRSVVIVTTDKVYQNEERDLGYVETDRLGGFDPYANSKACAELATAAYRNSFFADGNTLVATARAGNVIGGGDWSEDRLLPDVFRSLIFGEELMIRNPASIRPWQHVLEPLSGYLTLAKRLFQGDRKFADSWNFGPSDEDSKEVRWILNEIAQAWDGPITWKLDTKEQPHETQLLKLDSSKAHGQLDWMPRTGLADAVKMTAEWYQGFKNGVDLVTLTQAQIDLFHKQDAAYTH
jgi:CDP-glucose 4,6-dehydratase